MAYKVLAIDDDPEVLMLIKGRLLANNYTVLIANGSREAINLARQERPDVIIMDVLMPNLSGPEVAKKLKDFEETKNIPIIFLTSMINKDDEVLQNMKLKIDNAFYHAVGKPFDADKLLSTIEGCLKNR
jgi:two-component system, sensor histidine kinase and response regulator